MMMTEQLPDGTNPTSLPKQQLDHVVETAEAGLTEDALSSNNSSNIRRSISDAAEREPASRVARTTTGKRMPPRRTMSFVEKLFQKPPPEAAPKPQLRLTIKREAKEESKTTKKAPPRRTKSYGPHVSMPTRNSRKLSPTPPGRTNNMTKEDVRRQLSADDSTGNNGANMLSMITGQSEHKKELTRSHTGALESLSYNADDLHSIANDKEAFAKLKKTLKKHGAVTNEVLKQVLPLYVKHHHDKHALSTASAHCSRTAPGGPIRSKQSPGMRATVAVSGFHGESSGPRQARREPRSDRRKQASLSPVRRARSPKSDPPR